MNNYNEVFRQRTKQFALKIIRFCDVLPRSATAYILSKQLVRSSTSVAANYRAMCHSRSERERFAKLCIVVEEADETLFWLELVRESGMVIAGEIDVLIDESEEYAKVFSAYKTTLKKSDK